MIRLIIGLKGVFVLTIICLLVFSVLSQPDSEKKMKQSGEVRVNLLVLNPDGSKSLDVALSDIKLFEDGKEQKVTRIEARSTVNLGLIVDNSGSVNKRLKEIAFACSIPIHNMLEGDEAFIIRFVGRNSIEVVEDWTSKKPDLLDGIENMYVEGGQSAVIDALYLAMEKMIERAKKEPIKHNALVMITDGDDRNSYYSLKDIEKLLIGQDVQVFVIGFPNKSLPDSVHRVANSTTKKIAKKTGGASFTIMNSKKADEVKDAIINAMRSITYELRSQYVIYYRPTNGDHEELTRDLKVEVTPNKNGQPRTAILPAGFSVKPQY